MTNEEFREEVEYFVNNICEEYTDDIVYGFNEPEDQSVYVVITFKQGKIEFTRSINLVVNENELCISVADGRSFLNTDTGGLYASLFFEALKELEQTSKNVSTRDGFRQLESKDRPPKQEWSDAASGDAEHINTTECVCSEINARNCPIHGNKE